MPIASRLLVAGLVATYLVAGKPAQAQAGQADPAHQGSPQDQARADAQPEYPSLHLQGFADVNYSAQEKAAGVRGFSEGQFALHFASALSPRVNVFGELSFSPRADAGTGTPPATGFNAEVERIIVRFDQSDQLKVSFGRYHTPINWWNTAFHHGQWLQTTVNRPEMVQFGGRFIPVHFVGALAEGSFPSNGWNFNYQAGVGNGRGNVISRPGDAGDNNARPAWLANFFVKPDRVFGLQAGGSVYFDRISNSGVSGQPEFDERIVSAHLALEREDPEILAEIASVHHSEVGATPVTGDTNSLAYYIQVAYRLRGAAHLFKPYYRFERIDIDQADQVFTTVPNLTGSTFGVRFDISTYAAIKTEARIRRRVSEEPLSNGWFTQVAFTF